MFEQLPLVASIWDSLGTFFEFMADEFWGINGAVVLIGIVVCTAAGLLSLIPNPERRPVFVPVYVVTMSLFLSGLALILWYGSVAEFVTDNIFT